MMLDSEARISRRNFLYWTIFLPAEILLACNGKLQPTPTPDQKLAVDINIKLDIPNNPSKGEGIFNFPSGFFLRQPAYSDSALIPDLGFKLAVFAMRINTTLELSAGIGMIRHATAIDEWAARVNPIDFAQSHALQMRWSNFRFVYRALDGVPLIPTPRPVPRKIDHI